MRIAFLVFHSHMNQSDSVLSWQQFEFCMRFFITAVEFGQLSFSLTLANLLNLLWLYMSSTSQGFVLAFTSYCDLFRL